MRDAVRLLSGGLALLCWATLASGQTVTVVHNVNLRPDPSTEYPTIRLLTPSEPRLLVQQDCITVTGVIIDATAGQAHHQPDGVRHEPDGDTHGWLQVDSQFVNLINAGNRSDEGGNLVFEIVCHYTVTQSDAQPACAGFTDHTIIPPAGTHIAITGTFVQEKNHKHWNEIHPVSRIEPQ